MDELNRGEDGREEPASEPSSAQDGISPEQPQEGPLPSGDAPETPAGPDVSLDALSPGDTSQLAAIEESLSEPATGEPVAGEPVAADTPPAEAPPAEAPPTTEPLAAEPVAVEEALPGIDLGPERRSNLWVWIGLVTGILIALAAIGYVWWYATTRPIAVPDVVGKLPAQATQAINDAGLRLGKVSEVPTDTAPAGTIVSQSPEARAELTPGSAVSFVLAAPPETSKVPDVTGQSSDEAASMLVSNRLNPLLVESYSATVAADFVVSQLPTAGAALQPGGSVALIVSKGQAPTTVRVPHLTGLPSQDAAALLAPLDVSARAYSSFNNSVSAGIVVTQTPAPGGTVVAGAAVQYLVSNGPGTTPVSIPDVVGDPRKDAEAALKAKGLKPQVREVISPSVPKGSVISQMPPAGSRTASGGVVGLLVSKGNLTSGTVPDLNAKASQEASTAISTAGFRPVMVEIAISDHTAGQVFAQFPAAGSTWPLRFPVVCLVAKAP